MRVQKSYGIACYKYNTNKSKYEFLFIKKRLTYAFISFVKGIYDKNANDISISNLLKKMTVDEKMVIRSLDFSIIWYKCHLENINLMEKIPNVYNKYKKKFNDNFLNDNGKRLLYLLERSTSVNLIWELPKGHMNSKESKINAAIREFYEETAIHKYKYKILFNLKPLVYSFIDENVKYIYTYYTAKLIDTQYTANMKLNIKSVIKETSDLKFLSIEEIKLLVNDKYLYNELKKLIKILKNH